MEVLGNGRSSTAGLKGLPFLGAYVAAKHGVVGLVLRDLAAMVDTAPDELRGVFMNGMADPKVVTSEDVAAVVAWLASDEARYVTGAQIPVDLGMLNR